MWSPGNVEEDKALYTWQFDVQLVHLQLQVFVKVSRVTQLLQADFHVHTLIMEPGKEQRRLNQRDSQTIGYIESMMVPVCRMDNA